MNTDLTTELGLGYQFDFVFHYVYNIIDSELK